MNLNPSMKELFYTLEFQKETAPVDSMAIIGDEGEDVTALIAAKSEPKTESESAKSENKEAPTTRSNKRKKQHLQPAALPEESYCHHATTERHNDRRNSSHLVKQSDKIKEGDILAEIETDKNDGV
jgi:pyruvate dehydrogenase E2 component (dihydrolipoamide acetyltransferase)